MIRTLIFPTVAALLVLNAEAQAQHMGDFDVNGSIDLADVEAFFACNSGPDKLPEVGCWVFDFDLDLDVDFADFGALQEAFASEPTGFVPVMGIWEGSGRSPDGQEHPLRLTLAQWGYRIWGIGELTVTPGDPFNGIPAFHLIGSIHDNRMVFSMSGALTNLCFARSPDAYIATIDLDPESQMLSLTEVLQYLPVGCGQVVAELTVTRVDEPHEPGNSDILGTWEGHMITPSGWFYAPIPFWPPRESFLMSDNTLMGFMQVGVGNPWGTMVLEWDPQTLTAKYQWICSLSYSYKGVIDGNKFSGIFLWGVDNPDDVPDDEFHGVFSYTLQDFFIPPKPIIPGC